MTEQIDYLTADIEDHYIVAQANSKLNDDGTFAEEIVMARAQSEATRSWINLELIILMYHQNN